MIFVRGLRGGKVMELVLPRHAANIRDAKLAIERLTATPRGAFTLLGVCDDLRRSIRDDHEPLQHRALYTMSLPTMGCESIFSGAGPLALR